MNDILMKLVKAIKHIDDNPGDGRHYLPTQLAERKGLMHALRLMEPNIVDAKELYEFIDTHDKCTCGYDERRKQKNRNCDDCIHLIDGLGDQFCKSCIKDHEHPSFHLRRNI